MRHVCFDKHINLETYDFKSVAFDSQQLIQLKIYKH